MNFKRLIIVGISLVAILGCASRYTSSILVERGAGVHDYEREYLVTQEGYGIDARLKKIFVQGYVEEGMIQEMVRLLWGVPDREFEEGMTWEYVTKTGELITRVKFKKSELPRLGVYDYVVAAIEGDRYGGSLPPGSGGIEARK